MPSMTRCPVGAGRDETVGAGHDWEVEAEHDGTAEAGTVIPRPKAEGISIGTPGAGQGAGGKTRTAYRKILGKSLRLLALFVNRLLNLQ